MYLETVGLAREKHLTCKIIQLKV